MNLPFSKKLSIGSWIPLVIVKWYPLYVHCINNMRIQGNLLCNSQKSGITITEDFADGNDVCIKELQDECEWPNTGIESELWIFSLINQQDVGCKKREREEKRSNWVIKILVSLLVISAARNGRWCFINMSEFQSTLLGKII